MSELDVGQRLDVGSRFKILDPETDKRATIVTYSTEKQALDDIDEWRHRHERGGRPDISRAFLDRLVVVPEDGDYS
jgi:hypothetical protein